MEKSSGTRATLAVMAAVAGTGYASGRELVLFFGQMGRAGWIGVCFAPLVFGVLTALICRCAAESGAKDFPGLCRRLTGPRPAAMVRWLHGLLLALTAVVMVCGAGEMGALALPVEHGWLWGAGSALLIALVMNLSRLRPLPWLGLIVLTAGVLFYGALALDPRPAQVWLEGRLELALEGSWPASILLALAYGAMNAALAAGSVLRFGSGADAVRVGLGCGLSLGAMLAAANGAIVRGGRALLGQAMPTVLLAARWGSLGFWISAAFGYLCALTTLASALGGLMDGLRGSRGRGGLFSALAVAALVGLLGVRRAVGMAYPVVGWLCAVLMLALACRADALLLRGAKRLNFME